MKINTTNLAKNFIKENISNGDIVIDATMGQGNDTLFLRQLVGENGFVYAFDIQKEAIEATKYRLIENNVYNSVSLILDGHQNIDKYIGNDVISCVVFNFGYLPKGNHNIATKPDTSIIAIKKCLQLLKIKGVISLCVYQGGDTGFEEKDAILDFVKNLDYNKYTVIVSDFFNRPNYPPIHIKIIKEM
ncbi:class I SAM-dependent methyltransferase [uncultured Tyzzerella sp.]|uniref:tRNA (mnm(5)s(2)U34)-methyltransferase n=1 Tax=uncultured Tyzzerella sp. TaxID=2321398 RepID=UPI002942D80D|nr:class I SAM-dependent methyltransferase [uncultured Tyzzerella sp.]